MNENRGDRQIRLYRLLVFLFFTGLGVLAAWLLFNFKPPGGVVIMTCMAVGCFIGLGLPAERGSVKNPAVFEFKKEGRWPLVRKISVIAFLIFFLLAPIVRSPRLFPDEQVRRSLFLICAGLALLGGTPIMFALKSNLRLLGFCTLFMSLMLAVTGLIGIFHDQISPLVRMIILALGTATPLVLILFYLRRDKTS